MSFQGKKVLVMGLGLFGGGVAVAQYFCQQGARVFVTDLRKREELQESLTKLKDWPIEYCLGEHRIDDFRSADLIIANPGVPDESHYLQEARSAGVPIDTEVNIVLRNVPAPVVGITGSNGKSTTAAMIAHIFLRAGYTTWLGGNIGTSLLEHLHKMKASDWVVMELSSFQLDRISGISPKVAVVTNFDPNHLDRHKTIENYANAKQNILRFQKPWDICVLNSRYPEVCNWGNLSLARKIVFGGYWDIFVHDGQIYYRKGTDRIPIIALDQLSVPGIANQENAMAAISATISQGVSPETIAQALRTFQGLPHRLQFLGEFLGRKIYEDSDATTPESTIVALQTLKKPIVLLAGGADKGFNYQKMGKQIAESVDVLILMGQNAKKIREAVEQHQHSTKIFEAPDMDFAVSLAKEHSHPGDSITLSPGSASFGMFRNYEERAEVYSKCIFRYF